MADDESGKSEHSQSGHAKFAELSKISDIWEMEQSLLAGDEESVALNEFQVETLKEILFTGGSWASSEALGVLKTYSDFSYIEPLMESSELENRVMQIQSVSEQQLFNLYPNPASDFCVFERLNTNEDCTITLSDVTGRAILIIGMKDNQQQAVLETRGLASGAYLLRITNELNTVLWNSALVKQ